MEFYLPHIPKTKQVRHKIIWTAAMLDLLCEKFPILFNVELAKELGVSQRTLIRKARELSLNKIPGFLELNRKTITKMAVKARKPHPCKGVKGWCVPNSENTRFKKGHVPRMKIDSDLVKRVHKKRDETIAIERIRNKYGLKPITRMNLNY